MKKSTPMRLIKKVTETQDNKLSYIYFKERITYIAAFHHMKKITLLTHIFDLVDGRTTFHNGSN